MELKTKKEIIKDLQRANEHDLISLNEQKEIAFKMQEKKFLNNEEILKLFRTYDNIKNIKNLIKNRKEIIQKLKERN